MWSDRLIKWLSGNSTIGSFEDESEACMVQSQLAPSINQVRELLLWSNPTFRLFSVPESVLPLNGMFANPHYRSVNSCTAPLYVNWHGPTSPITRSSTGFVEQDLLQCGDSRDLVAQKQHRTASFLIEDSPGAANPNGGLSGKSAGYQ